MCKRRSKRERPHRVEVLIRRGEFADVAVVREEQVKLRAVDRSMTVEIREKGGGAANLVSSRCLSLDLVEAVDGELRVVNGEDGVSDDGVRKSQTSEHDG